MTDQETSPKTSAQDLTLQQYHQWMQINAMSHVLRAGRQSGIFEALSEGQRTLEQLRDQLSLQSEPLELMLQALVSIGIVEQYGEDFALARAAQLLCQYDRDLGDEAWEGLVDLLRNETPDKPVSDQPFTDRQAATQWSQTAAAIQVAEILDVGGDSSDSAREPRGIRILDLGCGSAVFSCAIAHHDPASTVMAVDHPGALQAARSTADSIELGERFQVMESDLAEGDDSWIPAGDDEKFDLVILAQRLSVLGDQPAASMLGAAAAATRRGGRVVVIDVFRGENKPTLTESIGALKLALGTSEGRFRTLREAQQMFLAAELSEIQFTYLAASREHLGMMVGRA